MPNWCKGCLKVRGNAANVKKFILEGLKPVDIFGNELPKLELSDIGDVEYDKSCWIEGTTRGFVKTCMRIFHLSKTTKLLRPYSMQSLHGRQTQRSF